MLGVLTWTNRSLQSLLHHCIIILGEKFPSNFISVKDGAEKGGKQGRDERTQKDSQRSAKIYNIFGSLLEYCHLWLIYLLFLLHPYLKWSYRECYFLVPFFFMGFLNHLPNRRWMDLLYYRRTLWGGQETRFTLTMKALVLETTMLKMCVQTSAPHSYTCSYQPLSNRTSLSIATHRYTPSKSDNS